MTADVVDVATLVARGYTTTGRVPGGRYGHVFYWPWATLLAGIGALGLFGGSALWLFRFLRYILVAAWLGLPV